MLITSALLFIAMREIWGWSLATAGAVAGAFVIVDASFFAANLAKVAGGGYVPLVLAALVYGVMYIWHLGASAVFARLQEQTRAARARLRADDHHRIGAVGQQLAAADGAGVGARLLARLGPFRVHGAPGHPGAATAGPSTRLDDRPVR